VEKVDAWRLTENLHTDDGKSDPFAAAVRATRMPMIITDPHQSDNPIIFANDAFLRMTGYSRNEVNGRNCRFLQGPETNPGDVRRVREAIASRSDIGIDLLNYRKDGSTFWNALYLSPVSNEAGELRYFFASQLDVTDRKTYELGLLNDKERVERAVEERTADLKSANERLANALAMKEELLHEVDHRVKNNMQIIASLIGMTLRNITDDAVRSSLQTAMGRVEAMSTVHRRFYQSEDVTRFDVGAFASELATNLVVATGRSDIRLALDLEPIRVVADKAAPLALMLNELATNAIKHGFAGDRGGTLSIAIHRAGPENCRIVVADDGPGLQLVESNEGAFGHQLVQRLARQLKAHIDWQDGQPGLRAVITVPIAQHVCGQ
jgi:PAS domain S-box-containing protein